MLKRLTFQVFFAIVIWLVLVVLTHFMGFI